MIKIIIMITILLIRQAIYVLRFPCLLDMHTSVHIFKTLAFIYISYLSIYLHYIYISSLHCFLQTTQNNELEISESIRTSSELI